MSKPLTTDSLINTIKRRAMLPTDQVTFTKQDFIDIANEEMNVGLVPFLLSTHEEYLVYTVDIALEDIQNSRVRIPSRAIGNKLRGASYVDSGLLYELTRVNIDDLSYFQNQFLTSYYTFAYYLQNDELILTTARPSATALRLYFYMRPSSLVEEKYGSIVRSINTTTGEIVVDKVPTTFSISQVYDFTDYKAPNKLYNYDIPIVAINNTTKTLTFDPSNIPTSLKIGDYITIADETIVPQVPIDLHPLLAQRAAVHCLEAIGDEKGLIAAQNKLQILEKSVVDLIDNRVEDAPEKINNLHSPLRQLSRRRYKRYY